MKEKLKHIFTVQHNRLELFAMPFYIANTLVSNEWEFQSERWPFFSDLFSEKLRSVILFEARKYLFFFNFYQFSDGCQNGVLSLRANSPHTASPSCGTSGLMRRDTRTCIWLDCQRFRFSSLHRTSPRKRKQIYFISFRLIHWNVWLFFYGKIINSKQRCQRTVIW